MRKVWFLVLASVIGAAALAEEPVAVVNGQPISREELNQRTNLSQIIFTIYKQFPYFAQSLLLTEEGAAFLRRYERDVLEQLILELLQLQAAKDRGIEPEETAVEERAQMWLDEILRRNKLTMDQLADILANQGRTVEDFRAEIAAEARKELMIELLEDAITSQVEVSEDDIQAYYDDHKDQFVGEDGTPLPLAEVRDRVTEALLQEKQNQVWQNWLRELRQSAEVTINL